jgi:hypothetical protein
MLASFQQRYRRFRFGRACAGVLKTPPVTLDSRSDVMLFAQLQHKDVLLALIAFKSFIAKVPVGAMRILNDGSLTAADRLLLENHLPGVQFLELAEVRTAACPRGGCWERLLWISRLSGDHFVIQLDSDTLAVAELPEVKQCIAEGRSFVIGTWDDQDFETMEFRSAATASYLATRPGRPHVQALAEANFDKLEDYLRLRYVRGCAGFSGFARGSVDRDFVEAISRQMRGVIGEAWDQWGSEQVMSNIVVANDSRAVVLPHPKYCDCTRIRPDTTTFVHFIGTCRFVDDTYQDMARRVIEQLRQDR